MRLPTLLLLLSAACTRAPAPPQQGSDTSTGIIEVLPGARSTADPASAWTPEQACDSAAAIAHREAGRATITRGTDSFFIGNPPYRSACLVTITLPDRGNGAPPVTFERGIGRADWVRVLELESDGEESHGYGLRRPGVVCKVFDRTFEPSTTATEVRCSDDRSNAMVASASVRPPPVPTFPAYRLDPYRIERADSLHTCYHYASYTVAVHEFTAAERNGVPGEDIFVRRGDGASCATDSLPGDMVIRAEFFNSFNGMMGGTVFTGGGDAPGVEAIGLVNAVSGRVLANLTASELVGGPPGTIGAWVEDTTSPASIGCEAGGQVVSERLIWVDVATGVKRSSGYLRCGFRS